MDSGTYHFSSAQEPTANTSIYDCMDNFAISMIRQSKPTLLVSGGTYANTKEMKIVDVIPFSFPFGIGGTDMDRQVKVSDELCIQHYMRISLEQFMEGPTILLLYQMYNRIRSYNSGIITMRSNTGGITLGEQLSTMTMRDIEQIKDDKTDHLSPTTKGFLKAVFTSCAAQGHTPEAAKYARRDNFAMLDYHGLNSVFVTTTPDDLCNVRVRIYTKPQNWVSSHFWRNFLFLKLTPNSLTLIISHICVIC
jgi:hypothetical protein